MNLEDVNGIVLYKDGIPHSFGVNRMVTVKELTPENFHDESFKKDIVSSEWFQKVGYPYDNKTFLRRQIMDMCAKGFTFILNGSSLTATLDETYLYTIQTPIHPSPETVEYLSSIYPKLKELLESHEGALFFGEPYDENGDYVWDDAAYSLDDFYDQLNIPREIAKTK